jgi:hypothetical protein
VCAHSLGEGQPKLALCGEENEAAAWSAACVLQLDVLGAH